MKRVEFNLIYGCAVEFEDNEMITKETVIEKFHRTIEDSDESFGYTCPESIVGELQIEDVDE